MASDKPKVTVISWSQLFHDTLELARKITLSNYKPEKLVIIVRGGLVIGRILSDLLQVKDILNVPVSFYRGIGSTIEKPIIKEKIAEASIENKSILIVDDIVDTGETLTAVQNYLIKYKPKEIRSATPYVKPWAKVYPTYYVKVVKDWIVFPYELRETIESLSTDEIGFLGLDSKTFEEIRTLIDMYNSNEVKRGE